MSKPNRWYDAAKLHHAPTGFTNPNVSLRDPGALKRWCEERKTPLAATLAELPAIDWVLYSHNHYDHLDCGTLRRLLARFPALRVAVPLGMGAWLRRHGVKHVDECD